MRIREVRRWAREQLDSLTTAPPPSKVDEAVVLHEIEIILTEALGISRAGLIRSLDEEISPADLRAVHEMVARRALFEPLAYILGKAGFYDNEFYVSPAVLIPRSETELLVDRALKHLSAGTYGTVLDVGTGSGAIVLSIAAAERTSDTLRRYVGLDVSPAALDVARRNALRMELDNRVRFFESDLLSDVPSEEWHAPVLIAANLPYISDAEVLPKSVADFEPSLALRGGADGLDFIRRLLRQLCDRTTEAWTLLLEIGSGQSSAVDSLLRETGSGEISWLHDVQGIPRIVELKR